MGAAQTYGPRAAMSSPLLTDRTLAARLSAVLQRHALMFQAAPPWSSMPT